MSRARRRSPKAPRTPKVEQPTEKETVRCYFCGNSIGPHVKIRRFHELTVHESCYQRDVAP